MDKLHPKAVIFDLGSTLIEYEAVPWSEMNVLCARSGRDFLRSRGYAVPADEEFFRAFEAVKDEYRHQAAESLVEWTIVQAAGKLLAQWNMRIDGDMLEQFFDAYYEPLSQKVHPYDDVLETLEKVQRRFDVIGLVSNTIFPERAHRHELRRFGIEPYLDFMVFSSSFGRRKPHPSIFYKAANLAGYAPPECVYVGDRYVEDVEGPRRVGMPAILKLLDDREYPPDLPPDLRTIRMLAELAEHLDLDI